MQQTTPLQAGSKNRVHVEIPWMKRWEHAAKLERAAMEDDHATRLSRIDYITGLEELEFR